MNTNLDCQVENSTRACQLLQEFFGEHGINPEIHIWTDEQSARIVGGASYARVAEIINRHGTQCCNSDDTLDVNTALYGEYEHYCEVAAKQIAEETNENISVRTGALHTWQGKDGYYYCFSSVRNDGIYSESEDVGPFEDRQDAIDAAMDTIEDD